MKRLHDDGDSFDDWPYQRWRSIRAAVMALRHALLPADVIHKISQALITVWFTRQCAIVALATHKNKHLSLPGSMCPELVAQYVFDFRDGIGDVLVFMGHEYAAHCDQPWKIVAPECRCPARRGRNDPRPPSFEWLRLTCPATLCRCLRDCNMVLVLRPVVSGRTV